MNRNDVTEKIISTKVAKGLQWDAIAKKVGQSKEWTTALCLGQMTAGRFVEQSKKFGFTHKGWGHAVGVYDLGGIGRRDIWFPEDYNFERVYLNETNSAAGAEPSEHFKDQGEILAKTGFGRNGMGVDIADVDNDGRPLVFVTHIYTQGYKLSGNSLWKVVERENGKFSVVQEAGERGVADCGWAWGGRFVDFDNDGSLELFVTNGFVSASKKKSYWYTMSVLDAAGPTILDDSLNWPPIKEASIDGYQRSCLFIKGQDGRLPISPVRRLLLMNCWMDAALWRSIL